MYHSTDIKHKAIQQQLHDEALVFSFSKCQMVTVQMFVFVVHAVKKCGALFLYRSTESHICEREVCALYAHIYVCVVVTFVRIVNSDIVLGRRKQFYLKRLCAYNSDHIYTQLK